MADGDKGSDWERRDSFWSRWRYWISRDDNEKIVSLRVDSLSWVYSGREDGDGDWEKREWKEGLVILIGGDWHYG